MKAEDFAEKQDLHKLKQTDMVAKLKSFKTKFKEEFKQASEDYKRKHGK